jgi:hypothetical protein
MGALKAVLCALVLTMGVGCVSFDGEWLEDGTITKDGTIVAPLNSRMALRFNPPSLLETGMYNDEMKVVDATSVQSDQYFLFDGWRTAQFGSTIARHEGHRLVIVVGDGVQRQLTRVKGKSIFPPRVRIPAMGKGNLPPNAERIALAGE